MRRCGMNTSTNQRDIKPLKHNHSTSSKRNVISKKRFGDFLQYYMYMAVVSFRGIQ